MRTLPVPTVQSTLAQEIRTPELELFPPQNCTICTAFVSVKGMEIGKALKLLTTAFKPLCECGMAFSAHGAEHPHRMPLVNCFGVQKREVS
jgi:hypothetical protein